MGVKAPVLHAVTATAPSGALGGGPGASLPYPPAPLAGSALGLLESLESVCNFPPALAQAILATEAIPLRENLKPRESPKGGSIVEVCEVPRA